MGHPNDDNGDALRRLEVDGDDLTRERSVDFSVVFPDQNSAETFVEAFREEGYSASAKFAQTQKDCPWDVTVVKSMVPSHQVITEFGNVLQKVAEPLGGRNDGWGCISQPGKYLQ